MGISLYVWAGILIVILFLLVRLIRWWNGPRIEEQHTAQDQEKTKQIGERVDGRNKRQDRRLSFFERIIEIRNQRKANRQDGH